MVTYLFLWSLNVKNMSWKRLKWLKAWSASSTSNSSTNGNSEHTEKVAAALLATKISDKRIISDHVELNQTQPKTNKQSNQFCCGMVFVVDRQDVLPLDRYTLSAIQEAIQKLYRKVIVKKNWWYILQPSWPILWYPLEDRFKSHDVAWKRRGAKHDWVLRT